MQKIRKAIIPVAGMGTRFLPATKAQPKEMLPVVDKPVIQYIVEEAVAAGIEEIIFVTNSLNQGSDISVMTSAKKSEVMTVKNVSDKN